MPVPTSHDFATLLKSYRKARGLTQEDLAARAGVSARAVSNLERGLNQYPHNDTLRLLLDQLDLSHEEAALFAEAARRPHHPAAVVHSTSAMTQGSHPSRLLVPLTPLIGRKREVAAILQMLSCETLRLLTLTGPAGVGKTRLALQAAVTLRDILPHEVVFVELSAVREEQHVLLVIAQALGVQIWDNSSLFEQLVTALKGRQMLLVLDNFEQILPAARDLVALLGASLALTALVTSREALHVRGEQEFLVPPLEVPNLQHLPASEDLERFAAVTLFVDRARAVRPEFALTTADERRTIATICARLDGLPLAIELAAAHIKMLSPKALLKRLDGHWNSLMSGARDLPERQRTLQSAISWSYDLLNEREQRLLRQLAVFLGGWSLEAAEQVCAEPGSNAEVFGVLASLLDKSLVVQGETAVGEPRYQLLETIRAFALEQLEASGEKEALYRRHAEYYLALAVRSDSELQEPGQRRWLARLDAERTNLRAVQCWAKERREMEFGLRLAGELWYFWYLHGDLSEGRAWLEELLTQTESLEHGTVAIPIRARALYGAGTLASGMGDLAAAEVRLEQALALWREIDERARMLSTLNNLGIIVYMHGKYEHARALFEENLVLDRAAADKHGIATTLINLGNALSQLGDSVRAVAAYEESLDLFRGLGDSDGAALALNNLGELAQREGDFERALACYEEALTTSREAGDELQATLVATNLGSLARSRGNTTEQLTRYHEALIAYQAGGNLLGIALCFEGLAGALLDSGEATPATRLLSVAATLREQLGTPLSSLERPAYEREVEIARTALGEEAFTIAWQQGRRMPIEQAILECE